MAPSWRLRSPDPGLRVHAQGQGREQEEEDGTFLTNLVVDLTQNLVDLLSEGDNAAGSTRPRVNLECNRGLQDGEVVETTTTLGCEKCVEISES